MANILTSGRRLRAGDWVQVRSKEEIISTLDANGRLDELPFMPEMLEYCGIDAASRQTSSQDLRSGGGDRGQGHDECRTSGEHSLQWLGP